MSLRIWKLADEEYELWQPEIQRLDAGARYPLGLDYFRLDHGKNYFAFFDRLGELAYYIAALDGSVVAVGCGIVRRLPFPDGERPAWYVGDLKVRPSHRGQHLPLRMLGEAFAPEYAICARGYGISMNPASGPNRVVGIIRRFPLLPIRCVAQLCLFSVDALQMSRLLPSLEEARGEVSFLSLAGIKEIVLDSTGTALPLLHAQFGPLADRTHSLPITEGATHMFCAPADDPLVREVSSYGIEPSATASIIALGMDGFAWKNVLTSEI